MARPSSLRVHLAHLLHWSDAHVRFDDAVRDLPSEMRGMRPRGLPHSPWELVEHIRITQRDILDFCVADNYEERNWPDDYWPLSPEPPDDTAWDRSIVSFAEDREELRRLAQDDGIDLETVTPHGADQTYLRELLLIADHTAYHVGQLVLVRRLLGAWPAA